MASLTIEFPEGPVILPMANTVWYSVLGTGETVTIDSAGSDFDTVVAVYTLNAGVLAEVACNDDPLSAWPAISRQSKLSFETEAGVVYLIQAGGFGGQSGHLKLSLD